MRFPLSLLWILLCLNGAGQVSSAFTDMVIFGNKFSEQAHNLSANRSSMIHGLFNEPARVFLPLEKISWQGGSIKFTLKVDSVKQNYITIRLSGDDVSHDLLNLICNGRQVGYRHLGDIEMLELGTDAPFKNGRFYYRTSPLPLNITTGQQTVELEIRSTGSIWGYGSTFDQYQQNMTLPSRGLYKMYSHVDPVFTPPAGEVQGLAPKEKVAPGGDEGLINEIKERINNEVKRMLTGKRPLSQVQMQLLAKTYWVKWTTAYKNASVINKITEGLDSMYVAYRQNPKLAEADPATWNPDWFGLGITGQVLWLLQAQLQAGVDKEVVYQGFGKLRRREAYTAMLVDCREWHRKHRRMYSNQSMINDLYGIYYANKGLQTINPAKAIGEKEIVRYLYESLGLQPWLGSEGDNGPTRSAGDNYWELTKKGLTKELGYVGNYGEVLDWATEIYEATRPQPDMPGNPLIKERVEKIALARTYFRYPATDSAGYRAMRLQVMVGWRDVHYPGDITYMQRASWDGTPFQVAVATMNPQLLAYTQQMLADNQFFSSYNEFIKNKSFRVTAGMLYVPDQYELVKSLKKAKDQLPMTARQPDFVFSDEEDGVVAVKNGEEYFYASLYWRARNGINKLGRIHLIQPGFDRIATFYIDQEFEPNDSYFTRPDYTNFGFASGGPRYPDTTHSAHAGQQLPVAKIPPGVAYKLGDESPYAGRASIYKMTYDNYFILMNNSDKDYEAEMPAGFANAVNLTIGKTKFTAKKFTVKSRTTMVLYKM